MLALMKRSMTPDDMGLVDIPEPRCGDDEVLVDVKACSVCGTDIHIMHGLYPWSTDVVLGHEYSGVIAAVGKNVTKFSIGERITGSGAGGYSRRLALRADDFIYHLPDNISFEEGTLFEPLSACTHAVLENSNIRPADTVLLSGPGSIGLCALQIAKAMGARVIVAGIDADARRLTLAKKLGADEVINISREDLEASIMRLTDGHGVDGVLECSGAQSALTSGLKLVRNEGTYTQIGLFTKPVQIDLDDIIYRKIRFMNSIGFLPESWTRSIELVRTGVVNLKDIISDTYPLSDWKKAFDQCEKRLGLKVIIVP